VLWRADDTLTPSIALGAMDRIYGVREVVAQGSYYTGELSQETG